MIYIVVCKDMGHFQKQSFNKHYSQGIYLYKQQAFTMLVDDI